MTAWAAGHSHRRCAISLKCLPAFNVSTFRLQLRWHLLQEAFPGFSAGEGGFSQYVLHLTSAHTVCGVMSGLGQVHLGEWCLQIQNHAGHPRGACLVTDEQPDPTSVLLQGCWGTGKPAVKGEGSPFTPPLLSPRELLILWPLFFCLFFFFSLGSPTSPPCVLQWKG